MTHIFAVLGLFAIFLRLGKPLWAVPLLFVAAITAAAILGWIVAVLYAEPMNRFIRGHWKADEVSVKAV